MPAPLKHCLFLLPGYELDGYPRTLASEESSELLAGWLALWHPKLLDATQVLPTWQQAESAPSDLTATLAVAPSLVQSEMDPAFAQGREAGDLLWFEPGMDWRENQQQVLKLVFAAAEDATAASEVAEGLRVEFAALGYTFLQIQLMTRQLRYTSNLDQILFAEQVAEAATAAVRGEREQAETLIQACFDTLGQERDHYYSLDVQLLDVTLLAPTTLGKSLSKQLGQQHATSFLAGGGVLERLAHKHPDHLRQLRQAIDEQQACVVGGLASERPHPIMSRESLGRDLERGRQAYRQLGLEAPQIFGRLGYGLAPDHAADLRRFGFEGAFLTAWSEGAYPEGSQAKISWEASDGTFLPALAAPILDATDAASFVSLGWTVGEVLDHQHVPTIIFAHWPGQSCDYMELLKVIARRTPALGKWTLADRYFADTDQPYHQERLSASGFRFNWLRQADSPGRWLEVTRDFHLLQARVRSLQNLSNLAWQLENYRPGTPSANPTAENAGEDGPVERSEAPVQPLATAEWDSSLQHLQELTDGLFDEPDQAADRYQTGSKLADELSAAIIGRLRLNLLGKLPETTDPPPPTCGRLLINPRSCPTRGRVQSDAQRAYAKEPWNFASGRVGHDRFTCIDVPSMGFVVAPFSTEPAAKRSKENPLAETGGLLQTEFLEAQIDVARGHLRSLHVPARRGNRLSLLIARRDKGDDGQPVFSHMAATDVRMLTSSNICGLVRAKGQLVFQDKPVADFEIDYEVWRGSRILEIMVRLSNLRPLSNDNPWRSAYVARVAWPTEAAVIRSHACGRSTTWGSGQTVAPSLIEIDETDYRTHYLTGGLAYHQRTERRFLETILTVDSQDMEHRLGIGVDLPYPIQAASDFLDERYSLPLASPQPLSASHGWMVSVDVKNVAADLECPLVNPAGETVGMRLFLSECGGKSTSTKVRLMHNVASAQRVDDSGHSVGKLTTENDSFTIALRSNEQCNVDVLWG